MSGARDEIAGIEELEVEDIVRLKEYAQERIETLGEELAEQAKGKAAAKR